MPPRSPTSKSRSRCDDSAGRAGRCQLRFGLRAAPSTFSPGGEGMGLFDALLGSGSGPSRQFTGGDRRQLIRLEKKVDLILQHLGIDYRDDVPPCPLSPEVQEL